MLTICFYRDFKEVCRLVIERVKEMPKHQLVMMWHQCYLEMFKFLTFKRL